MSDRPQRRRRGAPFHHAPEAVTYAREQAGLSQKELAERCGISQSLMCDIEAGRRNATPVTLRRMAAALNCPLVVLQSKRPDVPAAQRPSVTADGAAPGTVGRPAPHHQGHRDTGRRGDS